MTDRKKALGILKAANVFPESELELIMKIASDYAIEDMEILCSNPEFLRQARRFIEDGCEYSFYKGYFGIYRHDEELTKNPLALGMERLRAATIYQHDLGTVKLPNITTRRFDGAILGVNIGLRNPTTRRSG